MNYWQSIFEKFRRREQECEVVAEAHRAIALRRERHFKEHRVGCPPKAYARTRKQMVAIHPAVDQRMGELAAVRMTSKARVASQALETMIQLWSRYPYDELLYVQRCEDPGDAEAVVDVVGDTYPQTKPIKREAKGLLALAVYCCQAEGYLESDIHEAVTRACEAYRA